MKQSTPYCCLRQSARLQDCPHMTALLPRGRLQALPARGAASPSNNHYHPILTTVHPLITQLGPAVTRMICTEAALRPERRDVSEAKGSSPRYTTVDARRQNGQACSNGIQAATLYSASPAAASTRSPVVTRTDQLILRAMALFIQQCCTSKMRPPPASLTCVPIQTACNETARAYNGGRTLPC
jgi:hypothetical protein